MSARPIFVWCAILAVLAIGQESVSSQVRKRTPTVAILPFENANASAREQDLGKAVEAMLQTHLRTETNFTVLERARFASVLSEKQFADAGLTQETRDRLRQLLNVEVLLAGEVSQLDGSIQVDARLVSTATGEVVTADYVTARGSLELRDKVRELVKSLEGKYLRQWMGDLRVLCYPVEGEVYLDDQYQGKCSLSKPLSLNDYLEGDYRLRVLAGGYQKFEQQVTIQARGVREVQVGLQSLPGSLQIESDPAGAAVVLNGQNVGVTPLTLDTVAEGEYSIYLTRKSFKNWVQRVAIHSGQTSEVKAKLEVIPGKVLVQTVPSGAKVSLNDKLVGASPLLIENIQPGTVAVDVDLEGYTPWSQDVVVPPAEQATVNATLKRQTGKLTAVTDQGGVQGRILDTAGNEVAVQELPFHKMVLESGKYDLELSKTKYYSEKVRFLISADQETRIEGRLRLKPGILAFRQKGGIPTDVFIDGGYWGKAEQLKLELPEGVHEVRLRNWYGEERHKVKIVADESTELVVSNKIGRWAWLASVGAVLLAVPFFVSGGK